jgi:hypothetical protein
MSWADALSADASGFRLGHRCGVVMCPQMGRKHHWRQSGMSFGNVAK